MLGVYQGRLTDSGQKLQCFPKNPFQEFVIAAKLKYNFIEFFLETNINKKNPIWSNIGIKNYIKSANLNNIKTYSLCDNFYIKNSLGDKKSLLYALKVLKRAKLLKIKKYIIPMYGKSFLTKRMENLFIINLSIIARISSKYKIDLLLESNMSPKKFILMKKKISSPNIFFLFDCGNRAILKRDFFLDIKLFGKNIKHVHLKDKNSSNKNVLIGDGLVNFNLFF